MSAVKRTRDGIDILEHALQGVHTSQEKDRVISFDRDPGFMGTSSTVALDTLDGRPPEREVIVRMPAPRKSKRLRR